MSTRELVFPYRVVEGLDLRLSNPVDLASGAPLVGVDRREDEIGRERWDFIDAKPKGGGLEMDVSLAMSAEDVAHVLPDPSRMGDETVALVSIMCASTNYRRGLRLKPAEEGLWKGSLVLPREDVYGLVELTPSVVRTKEAAAGTDSKFGSFAGAVLAVGKAAHLIFDRSARRYDGSMEYVWEDFAQSTNEWRKSRKDDVFHLEPAETPVLFLNLRWPFLKPLLDFEGRSGPTAAMRDLTASTIAQGAWTQLFVTAIASISQDGESHFVAGEAWRQDLAKLMVATLYPDTPEEERMAAAYQEWHETATVGALVARIGAVTQSRVTLGKLMDRAAKAMESVTELASE